MLAGRDLLRTIRVSPDGACAEDLDLRAHILQHAAAAAAAAAGPPAPPGAGRDQLAIVDVKWSSGRFAATVATAAAGSGRVAVHDLHRPGREAARCHEHARQVHRLAFNPHQGALLLSASQDGTVRLWDLRDPGTPSSSSSAASRAHGPLGSPPPPPASPHAPGPRPLASVQRFAGPHDGIRAVQWSPGDGVLFATGSDAGAVARWDLRWPHAPVDARAAAHDGRACHAVAWHPAGRWLASAGADRAVRVWDARSADRRARPRWTLRAPAVVTRLAWRPPAPADAAGAGGGDGVAAEGSAKSWCVATAYDARDPRVHVWDFRRPCVPQREIDSGGGGGGGATDLLWRTDDALWTAGAAGVFAQHDCARAPRPADAWNVNPLAVAPDGQLCFFSLARGRRRSRGGDALLGLVNGAEERGSGNNSATEGRWEEGAPAAGALKQRRLASRNGATVDGDAPDSLEPTFQPAQIAAVGHVRGASDAARVLHLAERYRLPHPLPADADTPCDLPDRVARAFDANAAVAAAAGQPRLVQTWRILGRAAQRELLARAEAARAQRLAPPAPATDGDASRRASGAPSAAGPSAAAPAPSESRRSSGPRSGGSLKPTVIAEPAESTSNVPTPRARAAAGAPATADLPIVPLLPDPVVPRAPGADEDGPERPESPLDPDPAPASPEITIHALPDATPAAAATAAALDASSSATLASSGSGAASPSALAGLPDLDAHVRARRTALHNYRARPRAVLSLDQPPQPVASPGAPNGLAASPGLERHDSAESFQMFSVSAESAPRALRRDASFGASEDGDQEGREDATAEEEDEDKDEDEDEDEDGGEPQPFGFDASPAKEPPPAIGATDFAPLPEAAEDRGAEAPGMLDGSGEAGSKACRPVSAPIQRPDPPLPSIKHPPEAASSPMPPITTPASAPAHPFLLRDFLPPASPPPSPSSTSGPPTTLAALLPPLLTFHLDTLADPQTPTLLALYLLPFFPLLFAPNARARAALRAYHARLVALRAPPPAAALRRAAAATPGLDDALADATRGPGRARWWCAVCRRPSKGTVVGVCARCGGRWAPCKVCERPDPPPELLSPPPLPGTGPVASGVGAAPARLWTWCAGCGHGGHAACVRAVRAAEDPQGGGSGGGGGGGGVCGAPGCAHACGAAEVPAVGMRDRKTPGVVSRDSWTVDESPAARGARALVGKGGRADGGHRGRVG